MSARVDGLLIRSMRLERSWSQEGLAEQAGVSLRTVQRMESDGVASLKSRQAIAESFGLSANELMPRSDCHPDTASSGPTLARIAMSFAAGVLVTATSLYLVTNRDEERFGPQEYVATVSVGDIEGPIRTNGGILPRDVETIQLDAVGRRVELRVEPFVSVKEGQILAVIDGVEVLAPMSGTITSFEPMNGAVVSGTQTAMLEMEISNFDVMTVVSEIPETQISAFDAETEVYVSIAHSDRQWGGTLRRIDPVPRMDDGVWFQAYVDVHNADAELYQGMSAEVVFETGSATNVLIVPVSSLKFAPESGDTRARNVNIELSDGRRENRTIIVGAIDGEHAQVISGLDGGEKVVAHRPEG